MIVYQNSPGSLSPNQLKGFFVGWPNPPTPESHLALLRGSSHRVIAIDCEHDLVVGFVTATSDGVLSACIPLLEVLPAYQGQGIGTRLMQQILQQLEGVRIIDLQCDPELQPFYDRFGMERSIGMRIRNVSSGT